MPTTLVSPRSSTSASPARSVTDTVTATAEPHLQAHGDSVHPGPLAGQLLPPLPPNRSPLTRSSSPRHHSSARPAGHIVAISSPTQTPRSRSASQNPWRELTFADYQLSLDMPWPDGYDPDEVLDFTNLGSDDSFLRDFTNLSGDNTASLDAFPPEQTSVRPRLSGTTPRPSIPETGTASPRSPPVPATTTSRSYTQLTGTTFTDSLPPTQLFDDLYDANEYDDPPNNNESTASADTSFSEAMPTSRKRSAERIVPSITKRRRTSGAQKPSGACKRSEATQQQPLVLNDDGDDDLFGEEPTQSTALDDLSSDDLPTIDLTETNEVPEELLKPREDKRIKISAFQCVICMDDATNLTVTHCGHLYCAQCLHSSLHVDATRGKCPMCRNKIDMKPRNTYSSKTKGYWPLELRLMTVTRKGKQKAGPKA